MAQRTVALCDGKFIGIESIYTVVDGRQINNPDRLKDLRTKSKNNELFCPCGCGANLILVAGDKNLREQHFRIKDADAFKNCHMATEGKISVDSKIVLKCWLDDNLRAEDLESRVPISAVSDSSRKYELSFISRSTRIALNYCHDRANLSDEKFSILEENSNGIRIIHVLDFLNGGSSGQYPEGLMKVQNRQGYCLLLDIEEADYEKANLRAVFYEKNIDGLWQEITISDAALRDFRISQDGSITIHEMKLMDLLETAKRYFLEEIETEKQRREIAEKHHAEEVEARRLEEEKRAEEERRRDEDFKRNIEEGLNQQETPVRDTYGNRWIRCEYCGKIAKESEFSSYRGAKGVHMNLGTCKECAANNPAAKPSYRSEESAPKMVYVRMICPDCGSRLVEKNGINGRFIGCSGFPKCRYTRSIK